MKTFLILSLLLITVGMLALAPAIPQVGIGFDELPSGTIVTNQYAAAIFSSSRGHENYAIASPLGSPPNILCSGANGIPDCLQDTYIDFTQSLFRLDFTAIMQNSNIGAVAQFNIFEHGLHTRSEFLTGVGHAEVLRLSLQNLDFMTRLEIVNIAGPTGWDEFVLWQVPEPISAACLGLGILLVARCRRK